MHEARKIEVVALLLAPAAVGDDERAAPLDAHEVEEAQPRDAPKNVVVEDARSRPKRSSAAIVTGWSMKSSGVSPAASASTSIVSVSSRRLFRSSKRWSETMPNARRQRERPARRRATSSRLSRIVFEPVSTTSPRRRFDAAQAPGA